MTDRQKGLWAAFTGNEKNGSSAVFSAYELAMRAAEHDDEALTDIALVLQHKAEDAFFSDDESLSLYPMLYDRIVLFAKEHLDVQAYHHFCQRVLHADGRHFSV